MSQHRLFARTFDGRFVHNGHVYDDYTEAVDVWYRHDDERRAGKRPHVQFYSVRSVDWKGESEDPIFVPAKRHDYSFRNAARSTMSGHRVTKMDDGLYYVDGTDIQIEEDFIPTECEDRHPVKMTHELRSMIRANPAMWCHEAQDAAENFGLRPWGCLKVVKGYMCPGGEEHMYRQWIAFRKDGDSIQGEWADTPTDAAAYITDLTNRKGN